MTASPFPVSVEPHLEEVLGQIHDRLGRIEERMVTKDDLKGFATKDDLDVVVREVRTGYAKVDESLAAIHDRLDRQ